MFKTMKKKFVVFALVIAAFVAITSGCNVSRGYAGFYHHSWRGY
jgi:hypothetical protein